MAHSILTLRRELCGSILDVGGGGEGIIGRLYPEQVIAIDNCPEELEEAHGNFDLRLMDAAQLQFEAASFDHVTFFFSLMYMREDEQRKAIAEAARVLKPGGKLHLWDCVIPVAYPEPFCIDLEIRLPEETVTTTYGIVRLGTQEEAAIQRLCLAAGLRTLTQEFCDGYFFLQFEK